MMNLIILIGLLLLGGCHSPTKDEQYNNLTPNQIYQQGATNVQKKRYPQAIEDFEALEARYPFGEYADKAQLGAIYAYYLNEDYPSALPAIERFLRMYPRHPHVDYVYYMKGLVHYSQALGLFSKYLPMEREERDPLPAKKAFHAFQVLTTAFPHSLYAPDAHLRMIYLRNLLAKSNLLSAHFYLKKGAYLAAANRANYIIANFDQSPSIPEALAIMVQAYRQLNLMDLAHDAQRVLVLNYPDSPLLKTL